MTGLDAFFFDLAYWHWFALAAGLLIVEIISPGVVFLWLAAAAALVGALAAAMGADLSPTLQFVAFALASIVSVPLGRRLAKRMGGDGEATDDEASGLNRRGDAMVGAIGRLESASVDGHARARFGDTVWAARLADGVADLPADAPVVVQAVDGAKLIVAPR
ncbi:MAG: NfeD family protein [Pseudomonadota bacterium]